MSTTADERLDTLIDAVAAMKHTQVIPPETCPLIDTVIQAIKKARKLAGADNKYAEADELRDVLSDVGWELYGLEDTLEDVRTHNATLRQLGKDWSAIATDALKGLC